MANRFAITEDPVENRFAVEDEPPLEPELQMERVMTLIPEKREPDLLTLSMLPLLLPENATEKEKNELYYRAHFGDLIPFDLIDTDSLAFNAAKATTQERGFFNKVAESARRGNRQILLDVAAYESIYEGRGDIQRVFDAQSTLETEQRLDPIEGSFLAELVFGAANIVPGMAQGYLAAGNEALFGMVTGAGMGAIAGAPTVIGAPPAAVAGGITGLSIGLASGSSQFWYKQGAGAMASEMIKKGFDIEVSKKIAAVAAVPYAAIEFLQASQLTPGLRQGIQKRVQRSMLGVIAQATKRYGKTWSAEVVEEVLQEIIQIAAVDTAEVLSEGDITIDKQFLIERSERIARTAFEAGKSLALLPLPGAAIDVRTGLKSLIGEQKRFEINRTLKRQMAQEFTAEQKTGIVQAADIRKTELQAQETLTSEEQDTLRFLEEHGTDADALILGFGMERMPTSQLSLTGDILIDTANGNTEKLMNELAGVEPDADGSRKLTFQTATDANAAMEIVASIAENQKANVQIDVSGSTMSVRELTAGDIARLTGVEEAPRPSIAEQRRAEVERRLRAGEEVAADVREEFADLVAEIAAEPEAPPVRPAAAPVVERVVEGAVTPAKLVGDDGLIRTPLRSTPETIEEARVDNQLFRDQITELPAGTIIVSDPEIAGRLVKHRTVEIKLEESNETVVGIEIQGPDGWRPVWRQDTLKEKAGELDQSVPAAWFAVGRTNISFPKTALQNGIIKPAQPPTEAKAAEAAKPPTLVTAPPVRPVPAVKIVSPGEAGPLQVVFRPTKELPATRIVVDPQVRRSIQVSENKIAELKTKLKQARADKKVAVANALQKQIEKADVQIAKLKERQNIKLADTIEQGKVKVAKLKAAQKFSERLRRDAISLVRAIPKEIQKDFFRRASEVSTIKGLQKLADEIDAGIARIEKRGAIAELNKAVKSIKPKKMLPEFAEQAQSIIESLQLGKLREDTVVQNADLKEMAQQVLDNAKEDSIAAFQAQAVIAELRAKTSKTFAINQLSLEALEELTNALTALRFQNEVDTIAAKEENAKEAIRRRKLIKEEITEPPPIPERLGGAIARKFKLIHDNLESVSDAVGGARPGTYDLWKQSKRALTQFVYDVLDKGVDNQIIHNTQARDILRDVLERNKVAKKEIISWSVRPENVSKIAKLLGIAIKPEVHTFTLEDARGKATDFEWTVNELMSVFMHSRNSHNLAVLLNDGWDRFAKGKKTKIRGFTIEIIDDMIDVLTDQQKNVARQVGSKLMDGFNRDAINATSVKLVGYEIARVDRYWPARRSIIRTPKGEALRPALSLIENMGVLKERVGIGNPLRGIGFFETVHASSKNVSSYAGLAGPLREAKAVLSTDVIAEMEDSGREAEAKRIIKHIEKIEGQLIPVFETELEEIVSQLIGGFAKSKLFLNLKIAPRQYISAALISAYVDPKYMAAFRGTATKALNAEIAELSPQTGARIVGMQFDRDIGDAFQQNELLHYLTGDLSLIDKTGLGIRTFDNIAINDIYRAVTAEVIDKNPGIDIKSAEGKMLLKDRYEWVLRHNQPMWHVKDRSLLGASRNPIVRTFTMFMSQREQLVRMVNNAISDFANSDKTSEDATRLGRVLGTVTMNLVAFSVYNFAWALVAHRKKKDVKDFFRQLFKDMISLPFFGKYFAQSFEIIFNVMADKPVFKQEFDAGAVEFILKEILIDALPNFVRAAKHYVTGVKYQSGRHKGELKWQVELLVAVDSLIDAFASLKGLPYYGAKDIVKTAKAQIPKE